MGRMMNELMTNDAWRRARSDASYQRRANVLGAVAVGRAVLCTPSRFIRHSSFLIRASSLFKRTLVQLAKDWLLFRSDFFSDKNQVGPIGFKRFQLPAAGDEIE